MRDSLCVDLGVCVTCLFMIPPVGWFIVSCLPRCETIQSVAGEALGHYQTELNRARDAGCVTSKQILPWMIATFAEVAVLALVCVAAGVAIFAKAHWRAKNPESQNLIINAPNS